MIYLEYIGYVYTDNTKIDNTKNDDCKSEKKIIVYLVIMVVVLIYVATFFIYDIISRGTINISDSVSIKYPDNTLPNNTVSGDNTLPTNKPTIPGDDDIKIAEESSIKFYEDGKEWSGLKMLNIFTGSHNHVVDDKIAPGVEDTYSYTVECYGKSKMKYSTHFVEENPYKINMKFRLKRNGVYVAGDKNTWVSASQLLQMDMYIAPGTIDIFDLDWKWEDAPNDTEIGKTEGARYTISISSEAESVE